MNDSGRYEVFDCGDVALQCGQVLPRAQLAFKTYGTLDSGCANAILFPTWYAARHWQNEWLIGPGRALDPARWFIIVPNLFGNGVSSSPSNMPQPYDRARFPRITVYDCVVQQRRLLKERFGIERLALAIGRSMGAMQAFQFSCLYPDAVRALIATTGAARTSPHNYVFLAGLKAALTADGAWRDGDYDTPPVAGLRAFGRVYAGWIYSQAWYRERRYRTDAAPSLEEFLALKWDTNFADRDANDLLAQLDAWQQFDISRNPVFEGDFERALAAIKARAIVMPSRTDLYFPPEDSEYEVSKMPNAQLRVIPSIAGHRAAGPGSDAADIAFLEQAIREVLG